MADLLGHLVEGWATILSGSVAGSFQNPTSSSSPFSTQCETVLSLLGGLKGVKEHHLEEGREAGEGPRGPLSGCALPLFSSLLFPLFLCIQILKLAGGFPGRRRRV